MSTTLVCPNCNARLKAKTAQPVVRGKCPQCQATVELRREAPVSSTDDEASTLPELPARSKDRPEATRRAADAAGKESAQVMRQVLAGFQGHIQRRGPGLGYRLALLLTAIAIVVLWLLYFAFIGVICYGMYWYAIRFVPAAFQFPGRIAGMLLLVHSAVLFAAGFTVVSLLFALVVRRSQRKIGEKIKVSDAPLLHSFVEKIAETLHAPVPVEIRLVAFANASASVQGGLSGLLRRRLVLTIGGPLIAGMTTQQLAGVIAHELGHFSQRGGMLMGAFIGSFVRWCIDAFERQSTFSENLADAQSIDGGLEIVFISIVRMLQSVGAWATQGLAYAGILVTMWVFRRQEYDADQYEIALVGSDTFRSSCRRLIELNLGQHVLMERGLEYLATVLNSPDGTEELSAEIVAAADVIHTEDKPAVDKLLQQPTGWFDSHPSLRDRIAVAQKQAATGIFEAKQPAYRLFPQFDLRGKAIASA
jgi:Zn-dependent protease with chaperone function/phage FluMu protein Com